MTANARTALLLLVALLGCEEEAPRPWQKPPDRSVIDESKPFLPDQPDAALPLGTALGSAEGGDDVDPPKVSRVGGMWVSCYGRFHTSGKPTADVTRLAMVCGPENGMTRASELLRGSIIEDGTASTHPFEAKRGECYRVFSVGGGDIGDLDVTVKSSRGSRLAADDTQDNWPIVEPDRPFCTFDDDTFVIEVTSEKGSGPYALEVWKLPAR